MICFKCKSNKSEGEFGKRTGGKPNSWCKTCSNKASADWKNKNRDKVEDARLKRKYNITLKDVKALIRQHKGRCAICQTPTRKLKKKLNVDHCHETGIVRGLLCHLCNTGLGYFGDSVENLMRAVSYLTGKMWR